MDRIKRYFESIKIENLTPTELVRDAKANLFTMVIMDILMLLPILSYFDLLTINIFYDTGLVIFFILVPLIHVLMQLSNIKTIKELIKRMKE